MHGVVVSCSPRFPSTLSISATTWIVIPARLANHTLLPPGPWHYRQPSKMFWRTIRGMLPHKTPRGAAALGRLKTFEGIPPPYDTKKRVCVPAALRVLRLRPESNKWSTVGRLAQEFGWKYRDVVSRLEERRKAKSKAYYERAKQAKRNASKAKQMTTDNPARQELAKMGF